VPSARGRGKGQNGGEKGLSVRVEASPGVTENTAAGDPGGKSQGVRP